MHSPTVHLPLGALLSWCAPCVAQVGVCAPLYGGALLGRLGVSAQPAVAAAHYVALLVLAQATICSTKRLPDGSAAAAAKKKAD